MNRKYTRASYEDIIHKARQAVPSVEFTSDFIVGFPGETDQDFEATVDLVRKMEFLNTFVFKYSPRPKTRASKIEDNVPDEVKRSRNNLLLAEQKTIQKRRNTTLKGLTMEVLVEGTSPRDKTRLIGRSRNNRIIVFPGNQNLAGTLQNVKICHSTHLTLFGEINND